MTLIAASLRAKLHQAGIKVTESANRPLSEVPWFVRALQVFSGWLAAVFLLGFIAMGAVFVVESPAASMGLGLIMLGAAFALLRAARSDVTEHLALAISLAGQLLVAWAWVELWENFAYLWWSLLGLQGVLALGMPSQVHRSFSAFAASVALYMALAAGDMAPLASGLVLLAFTALWLNEFRWPGRLKEVQAWGYGLLVGLLLMQGLAYSDQSFVFSDNGSGALAWLGPWLGVALAALALWLLLRAVTRQHGCGLSTGALWAAYGGIAVLMLVSVQAPGVGQGVVILLLGFAIGHRLLAGFGVLSLLLAIGSYYYWLDVTLLVKAVMLLAIGLLLLAIRWALRRLWGQGWRASFEPEPLDGERADP